MSQPLEGTAAPSSSLAQETSWLQNIRALSSGAQSAPAILKNEMEARRPETGAPAGEILSPPVPETVAETGLSETFIEQHLLKILYFRGEVTGRGLAAAIGFKFSVIEPVLDNLKRLQLIAMKKSLGMGSVSGMFSLSESGRLLARDHLQSNQYAGPAPVPLDQYITMVRHQRFPDSWLTKETLVEALKGLVLTPEIISQIGPAVNAGKSFLIYGQPGNGKTFLAESLFNIQTSPIFIPYAVESQGQIIQVYDPIYHQPLDSAASEGESVFSAVSDEITYDRRWFKCRRPFITTGGELSLGMLDLSFNTASKVYDAPFQLKANNGIYLIDDFGRQKVSPQEVLNRWIVPMERKVDYLTFQTGGKMTVPFECFLIFSTNLNPDQLGDEAFLRRIQYKMMLKSPSENEFREIFHRFCKQKELPCTPEVYDTYIELHYRRTGKRMRRCHPRDVLTHAIDLIKFERLAYELSDEVLHHAFESCFLTIDHRQD